MKNKTVANASEKQDVVFSDYTIEKPLSECIESMLIDSDTVIAAITAKSETGLTVELTLEVRGCVSVTYKGQVYNKPSEFPEELRQWILKNYTQAIDIADMTDEQLDAAAEACGIDTDEEDEVYVTLNNWFEYIYEITDADGDTICNDGILCEDELHTMTDEQLRSEMEEVARQVLQREEEGS